MATLNKNTMINKAANAANIISQKTGVPAEDLAKFLTGLARVESSFNPAAENPNSTARGLTQVLINTQRWIEDKLKISHANAKFEASKYPEAPVTPYSEDDEMFNPDYALLIGGYYLAYNFLRYDDWYKAVSAYYLGHYDSKNSAAKIYKDKVLAAVENLNFQVPKKKPKNKLIPVRILTVKQDKLFYRQYY